MRQPGVKFSRRKLVVLKRIGLGLLALLILPACSSKTKATGKLLDGLGAAISKNDADQQECRASLDHLADALVPAINGLTAAQQRGIMQGYSHLVPLVRAELGARRAVKMFLVERDRCHDLAQQGVALKERMLSIITANVGAVPQKWLSRSATLEKDLVEAKKAEGELTVAGSGLLDRADQEFSQMDYLRGRGCLVLEKCGALKKAEAIVGSEDDAGVR